MKNKLILMLGIVLLVFVVTVFAVAPDQPTLNSPANNTVVYNYDNQTTLNITVTDNDSDFLNVSFYNRRCYQETANESTGCGGLDTGNYNIIPEDTGTEYLMTDKDWSSYGNLYSGATGYGTFYVNYSLHDNVDSATWQIKEFNTRNASINDTCLKDPVELKYYIYTPIGGPPIITHQCYNGSEWINLTIAPSGGTVSGRFYEEAMWWNISKNIGNATNIVNGSYATYNWTNLADGDYEWYASITDGTGTTTSPTYSFSIYDYNYTVNHTSPVLETSSQTFTLNITKDPLYIEDGNATLHWNDTSYPVDATVYDTYLLFSKTLTIPSVSTDTNITLNWTYEFWNPANNSRETNRTEDFTQTIYNIDMDDCSTYNITALNFTLIEESNNASINGSMDFTFSLVQEGTTVAYSKSVTNRNWTAFCIPTGEVSFTAQLQSEYTATGYDAHTYFAYNLAITNTSQDIVYYLTNGTSIVEFTVLDQNGNKIEDAYIKVMKYDIGTGAYITIEVLKTDELGKALGNIILDTTWYRFIVEYEGDTYLTTSATKMTSTTRTFTIDLLTDFFDRYTDVVYNIYSTLNYTDETGNFAFTYSDPNGNYHQGCLRVERFAAYGNTLINETCVSSTASTILVNVNDSGPVNGTYVAVGYVLFDDKYTLNILTKTWGHLSDVFGIEGLFYAFFIILTMVMVGVFNPKLAIILGMIGLVISNIIGFMFVELGWLVVILIAAGLTMYRMRDN